MKKLTKALMMIGATALYSTTLIVYSFDDVAKTHEHADAINYVQQNAIVSGYDDGTYRPDTTINRAEFTKIVTLAVFDEKKLNDCLAQNGKGGTVFFPDVPANVWFAKHVCIAKTENIIAGYPDGTFKPEQNISFVEAAKIIVLAFGGKTSQANPWYKPYVEELEQIKNIPTSIATFEQNITRGQMAELIYRMRAKITNKTSKTYNQLAGISEEKADENETANNLPANPEGENAEDKTSEDESEKTVEDGNNQPADNTPAENNNPESEAQSSVKEFQITAKQWQFTPATIEVTEGDTVKLTITSIDVTHGFFIDEFKVNERLEPGKTVVVEFIADKAGEYSFFCSVQCGSGHSGMTGKLIVKKT